VYDQSIRISEPGDPNRCIGSSYQGQCKFLKMPGSDYCSTHRGQDLEAQNKLRNYRLQTFKKRVNEFADSDVIKSLREEIGILRLLLEEVLNQCTDATDLLLYSSKIADLTTRIEHLVLSCHRIENNLGFTLDKSTVLNISSQIVTIISKHIDDPKVIDIVINEISTMIEQ